MDERMTEWAALQCSFVGDNEGNLQGFDARQKQLTQTALNIHDKKINTVNVSSLLCHHTPCLLLQHLPQSPLVPTWQTSESAEHLDAISLSARMLHCLADSMPTTLPLAK